MKQFIATLFLSTLPCLASAVTVDNCPKNLDVRLADLSVISAQKLSSQLSQSDNDEGLYEKFRQSLAALDKITVKAVLTKAAKARCEYTVTQSSVGSEKNDEFVLATSKGKDWIRLRLNTPAGIIGGYITVTSYDATHGIETSGAASLGMDDAGHPGMIEPVIAWAKSVEVK